MTSMYRVILSEQASDFLTKLTGKHRQQMASALDVLAQTPDRGKPLKGELKGYWSFRVGIYRILYSLRKHEVLVQVLRIQHRKEVYEKFRR